VRILIEPQYYTSGVSILLDQKSPIRDWAQVRGRNICLTQGAFYNRTLIERFLMVPQLYSGTRDTRLALMNGSCEGWIYDDSILKRELLSGAWQGFYMPLTPIMDKPWTLAIHKSARGSDFHVWLTATVIEWHRNGFILARERAWGLPESLYLNQQMAFWQRQNEAGDDRCVPQPGGLLPEACRPHPIDTGKEEQAASGWLAAFKSYGLDFSFLNHHYDRHLLVNGLWHTLMLSLGSILGSLVIGVAFALMRDSNNHLSRLLAITVGEGFRQTPPLLHLYIFIFGLGSYLSSSYDMRFNPLFIAIISFSLYAGAANGRILAQSLSFSRKKESDTTPLTKRLLNAFDTCYESLVANSVNLVKLVGMASIIAVPEIIGSGNSIIVERGNQSTMMNILLIFYLIIVSLFLTVLRKGKGVTERWAKRIS
jgi:polar amino acid transport system substrate-binding protein